MFLLLDEHVDEGCLQNGLHLNRYAELPVKLTASMGMGMELTQATPVDAVENARRCKAIPRQPWHVTYSLLHIWI